jgi:hypothetical protein
MFARHHRRFLDSTYKPSIDGHFPSPEQQQTHLDSIPSIVYPAIFDKPNATMVNYQEASPKAKQVVNDKIPPDAIVMVINDNWV